MPPALAKVVLSTIKPTEKELAEAKAHIEALNCAQQNSKRVSMNSFLKKNPDPESLQNADKGAVMQTFHVHVMRCKMSEKKWSSQREVTTERTLSSQLHWMSEEKLFDPAGGFGNQILIPFGLPNANYCI